MRKFGRFTGEEAEIFLRISHTKGVKGDLTMKSAFRLTIHDIGVERNEEQKKALRKAWLIWVVYGLLFLFFGCLGLIMGGSQGVLWVITIGLVLIFPVIVACADYYAVSITATNEQLSDHEKQRIYKP